MAWGLSFFQFKAKSLNVEDPTLKNGSYTREERYKKAKHLLEVTFLRKEN